jgi:uncharacterized protein YcfL
MSKWLTVCIFVLLAIACTVDVEPSESVNFVRPVEPTESIEIVRTDALAAHEQTSASASLEAEGDMPRALATRGWSRASVP